MADSMWDRVKDFARDHSPEWLQKRMESREMDRMADEQYTLYKARKAAGFYDEPTRRAIENAIDEHAPQYREPNLTSPIKEWVQEKRQELEARENRVEVALGAKPVVSADRHVPGPTEKGFHYFETWDAAGNPVAPADQHLKAIETAARDGIADARAEADEAKHIYAQQEREENFRKANGFRDRDGVSDAETERLIDRMQSTASPSYAEYQRDLANGVKLETAWDAHERRVIAEPGIADPIAKRDAFAQEFTDRRTNKEYRVEATYLGKTGHAIEVRDVETENVLYSGKTKDQNPLGALDEGRQWLRDNVLKPSAAQHDLELFRDTQRGKAWAEQPRTVRGWVADELNKAGDARRAGHLPEAWERIETARQDRIPYLSPDRGLSR